VRVCATDSLREQRGVEKALATNRSEFKKAQSEGIKKSPYKASQHVSSSGESFPLRVTAQDFGRGRGKRSRGLIRGGEGTWGGKKFILLGAHGAGKKEVIGRFS